MTTLESNPEASLTKRLGSQVAGHDHATLLIDTDPCNTETPYKSYAI